MLCIAVIWSQLEKLQLQASLTQKVRRMPMPEEAEQKWKMLFFCHGVNVLLYTSSWWKWLWALKWSEPVSTTCHTKGKSFITHTKLCTQSDLVFRTQRIPQLLTKECSLNCCCSVGFTPLTNHLFTTACFFCLSCQFLISRFPLS